MNTNESKPAAREALLNEFQRRRLLVSCHYIDKLLGEIEQVLNLSASTAAFPRYAQDIPAELHPRMEESIARTRSELVRVLNSQQVSDEEPSIPASRAVQVLLGTIDIAIEELKPRYMQGYGEVSEAAAMELEGIVGGLRRSVSELTRYLAEGCGSQAR